MGQSIQVIDRSSGDPLIGATVQSNATNTVTDLDGRFEYMVTSFPDNLTISYVGYGERTFEVRSVSDIPTIIELENLTVLETMTVTASKYQRRLSESTVSVDVLKPELISNSNAISIEDALDKVSGVQMVDGQANIRGGSGYSYGAGSRVMLLVDDMPVLQTNSGSPNFSDIPVENIGQVEIVKGASSSLYGSAALNGIINIRTADPTTTPTTKVTASRTIYDTPQDSSKHWWGDSTRYGYMLSIVHKQKVGKLDVVGSLFNSKLESFNQATFENKLRGGAKLKYRLSDKAFIGLNTVINRGDNGNFFIWEFGQGEKATRPIPNGEALSKVLRYFIDPSFQIEDKHGINHRLLGRYHSINNDNNDNQSNQSVTYYGEYQVQKNFESIDLLATMGIVASTSNTDAELFGDTTFNTQMFAYYGQLEKSFGKLNLSGGVRYEYNQQNTPEEFNGLSIPDGKIAAGRWVSRVGASYEYMPYSSLRASWGQGYRFPTITERFITTTFGVFKIESNPDLVPESGWSAEVGIKQGLKLGPIKGYLDAALFTSQYQDMMEFTFGFSGFNPAFTSKNVGDTKINGFEVSLFGTVDLGPVQMTTFGGYTYINPVYQNFEGNDSLQVGLSADVNVLKYRSQHNGKIDVQFDYKGFSLATSYIRSSHVVNIDAVLEGRGFEFAQNPDILGVKAYRAANNNGWQRWDLRASYQYEGYKLSFLISNLGNREYTLRPALLEAPRNYALRFDYVFQWKKPS